MQLEVASPILGFEEIEDYELQKIDDYFYTLKHDTISFTLTEPGKLRSYAFDLPPFYAVKLEAEASSDLLVLAIVILQNPIENSVINFLAPIVFNREKKVLVQVPLDEQKYHDFGIAEQISRYL
ncbi:MAG TPA: flagellar biosynthesis protein FliW [Campylobacteraceae bacterium]|nr:flagellar biosynthesis protein FliW [Campylobacteraceae bacterium]